MNKLSLDEALERILSISKEIDICKSVPIWQALGHVNARDITCKKDLPAFNNSAMDGYAFKFSEKDNPLHVRKSIFAGDCPTEELLANECYKIMTGAKVPNDVDTIAEFEKIEKIDQDHILVSKDIKKQNAFRFKGEEVAKGDTLIPKGTLLKHSHIMLLASQGIVNIDLFVRPKIVIISTGDEIVEPWERSDEDTIFNANTTGIISMLSSYGFEADYGGVVPDNLKSSVDFFALLKENYDVIISSGGVSMGDADFVKKALNENGFKEEFHGVNIKPGKPILAGLLGKKVVISLPGNPMASFLETFIFVLPVLRKISNFPNPHHAIYKAKNSKEFFCKNGRSNIILGTYKDGRFEVTNNNKSGSGMITPIVKSNCIAISDEEKSGYKVDDNVNLMML